MYIVLNLRTYWHMLDIAFVKLSQTYTPVSFQLARVHLRCVLIQGIEDQWWKECRKERESTMNHAGTIEEIEPPSCTAEDDIQTARRIRKTPVYKRHSQGIMDTSIWTTSTFIEVMDELPEIQNDTNIRGSIDRFDGPAAKSVKEWLKDPRLYKVSTCDR